MPGLSYGGRWGATLVDLVKANLGHGLYAAPQDNLPPRLTVGASLSWTSTARADTVHFLTDPCLALTPPLRL